MSYRVALQAMQERPVVISWGELLWDLFEDGPRLGGAAANVAYHLAQLGADSVLISRVGNDELGAEARQRLQSSGVDTRYVQADPDQPTGSVLVSVVGGEPRYKIATEVAWDRIAWLPELGEVFGRARVVCYSTLAQRTPVGFATFEKGCAKASEGCVFLCDLNIRPPFFNAGLVERALDLAHVVKLNEGERDRVRELFGVDDVLDWLVRERGKRAAVLTLGAKGSRFVTAEQSFDQPAVVSDSGSGDSVGAGDAFVAVLAHGLARELPLDQIAWSCSEYAGFVASQPGAMPPVPAVVRRRASGQTTACEF